MIKILYLIPKLLRSLKSFKKRKQGVYILKSRGTENKSIYCFSLNPFIDPMLLLQIFLIVHIDFVLLKTYMFSRLLYIAPQAIQIHCSD